VKQFQCFYLVCQSSISFFWSSSSEKFGFSISPIQIGGQQPESMYSAQLNTNNTLMKENQTICQFLGITVAPGKSFDIKNNDGHVIYQEFSDGEWVRYERDMNAMNATISCFIPITQILDKE
jgi:hypothetical protein